MAKPPMPATISENARSPLTAAKDDVDPTGDALTPIEIRNRDQQITSPFAVEIPSVGETELGEPVELRLTADLQASALRSERSRIADAWQTPAAKNHIDLALTVELARLAPDSAELPGQPTGESCPCGGVHLAPTPLDGRQSSVDVRAFPAEEGGRGRMRGQDIRWRFCA